MWLADPKTKEPLGAIDSKEDQLRYRASHWKPGWRSGFDRDEKGMIIRMWFQPCPDECCVRYREPL